MSQEVCQTELRNKTQQLLQGPLKHIRGAALAAALLPLASVAAAPASAQDVCSSGGICGTVFNDVNHNNILDAGDVWPDGTVITVHVRCLDCPVTDPIEYDIEVNPDGSYKVDVPGGFTYLVSVLIPTEMEPSSPNFAGPDANVVYDNVDSDGVLNGAYSSVLVTDVGTNVPPTGFGFFTAPIAGPGTGTPGYWKNHPDAWPVNSITVGGVTYTVDEAIALLRKLSKDKTTTMFSSLVSAKLNLEAGNKGICVDGVNGAIALADAWMHDHPVGSNVLGSSPAWKIGEPIHITLDNYNNGWLCDPHRR